MLKFPLDLPATRRSIVRQRRQQGGQPMAQALTIGQLAQATGVSAKTIRYSEQVGVLPRPVPVGTVKLSRLRYGNRG